MTEKIDRTESPLRARIRAIALTHSAIEYWEDDPQRDQIAELATELGLVLRPLPLSAIPPRTIRGGVATVDHRGRHAMAKAVHAAFGEPGTLPTGRALRLADRLLAELGRAGWRVGRGSAG